MYSCDLEITLARNNILSFWKKFQVADILLYKAIRNNNKWKSTYDPLALLRYRIVTVQVPVKLHPGMPVQTLIM